MSFDIHFQGVPPDEIRGRGFLAFGVTETGRHIGIRGIQKLVNRYVKCLLTPLDSDISDSNYGTLLMSAFASSVDPGSLQTLVAKAVQDAGDVLRLYDAEYQPDEDERFASVEIEKLIIEESGPGVELHLRIQNAAGTVVLARLPIVLGQTNG